MSGFSAEWLALREPYDAAACNPAIRDAAIASIRDQQNRLGGVTQIHHVAVRIVHGIDRRVDGTAGGTTATPATARNRARSATLRLCRRAAGTCTRTASASAGGTLARRRATEGVQQLRKMSLLAVVEHVIGAVAVAHPEIHVGRDGKVGGPVV